MSRVSGRRGGMVVCVAAIALSLTVGIGFGEESSAIDKPERIIATDYSSIQEAIDAAKRLKVFHIYIPSGTYNVNETLNLTGLHGGIFEGTGSYTTILQTATGNTPAMDLTNSVGLVLKNFQLTGSGSVGILMARKGPERLLEQSIPSSGNHEVRNVKAVGFGEAAVMSYGSGPNYFYSCHFSCGGAAVLITDYNREGVKSPYVELRDSANTTTDNREGAKGPDLELGNSTNTTTYFYGTLLIGGGGGSVGLRVSGASDVSVIGGMICADFAGVYLDGTGHLGQITIRDVHMEAIGQHSVYAVGAVRNVIIEEGY